MALNTAFLTVLWAWSQNHLHRDLLLSPGGVKQVEKKSEDCEPTKKSDKFQLKTQFLSSLKLNAMSTG